MYNATLSNTTKDAMTNQPALPVPLPLGHIFRVWWPLAISWIIMTTELPLISAVIARLDEPEINLAAWGVVFAVTTIFQAPSMMLLAASTALSQDWPSYRKLQQFTLGILLGSTILHGLVVFTPLYDILMTHILGVPPELVGPARLGLMIFLPWSAGTGYRRFEQGVLIRFDHAKAVVWGSCLRLMVDCTLLAIGIWMAVLPGIVVGTMAIISGVFSEMIYTRLRVRPVLHHEVRRVPVTQQPLTLRAFANFYVPLALTVLLTLFVQPLVSAALSRMPNALESLAVWPVVFGMLIVWQSVGIGYNEAVITLLEEPHAVRNLRRFTIGLSFGMTGLLAVMLLTPLARLWFEQGAALAPSLVPLAEQSLWFGLLLPALRVWQSWYQGAITYSRQTQGITEAVMLFLLVSCLILWSGVMWGEVTGIYVGLSAVSVAFLFQVLWLRYRSLPALSG